MIVQYPNIVAGVARIRALKQEIRLLEGQTKYVDEYLKAEKEKEKEANDLMALLKEVVQRPDPTDHMNPDD